MRPIKFRVWDIENKEWLEYAKVLVGWQTPIDAPCRAVKMHCYRSQDGAAFSELQWCLDHPEAFAVCQFIGLRDKNGKEAHAGDIFLDALGMVFPITINDFHGIRSMWGKNNTNKWDIEHGEIIGNIYENHDLLKGA